MQAKDIMCKKHEFLPPTATLKEVAAKMDSINCGFVPIGLNDRLIGAVTDRDIAIRAVAKGKDPNTTTAQDVMTKSIEFCFETDDLTDVVAHMEQSKIRRIVVLDKDKRMTGIISLGDVATKSKDTKLCSELADAVSH